MQVAPGVIRLTNGISNLYLVEDGGDFALIDAGVRGDWDRLAQQLAALGRSPQDLRAILLTHAHSDHTGFAERARSLYGIRVHVHDADAPSRKGENSLPTNRGSAGTWVTWRLGERSSF
jgi:glyoxylase-like metal-dependent hydrolase (beta-lactamase superfamily II)